MAGRAGASALREYERRHADRERHAREKLGELGVLLSRVIEEPHSTKVWRQGAHGELLTAERLEKRLRDHSVLLLHDRRVPGHRTANIDHIAVGSAGVLVIDSKTHRGKVRTDKVGGLFAQRRQRLLIAGRDKTALIDGVERQVGYVREALSRGDTGLAVPVHGALCFPDPGGLPLLSKLRVRDITIAGTSAIAKLACQPGPLKPDAILGIWQRLAKALAPA